MNTLYAYCNMLAKFLETQISGLIKSVSCVDRDLVTKASLRAGFQYNHGGSRKKERVITKSVFNYAVSSGAKASTERSPLTDQSAKLSDGRKQ